MKGRKKLIKFYNTIFYIGLCLTIFYTNCASAAKVNEFEDLSVYLHQYDFVNSGASVSFSDKRFSFSPVSIADFKSRYIKDNEPDDLIGLYVSNVPAGGELVSYSPALNLKLLGLVGKAPKDVYIAMANMDVGFMRISADGSIKDGIFVVHYFSDVKFGVRFHKAVRYIFDGAVFDDVFSKMSEDEVNNILKGV